MRDTGVSGHGVCGSRPGTKLPPPLDPTEFGGSLVELYFDGPPPVEIIDIAQDEQRLDDLPESLEGQFERDLLIERTQAGMARARAQGKKPGRPAALTPDQRQDVRDRIENGETISAIAREMKTSRQTIMRVRDQG